MTCRLGRLPGGSAPAHVCDRKHRVLENCRPICRARAKARYLWVSRPHTILFVCSGNTCRSPMAEAIARSLLAAEGDSSGTIVRSAGASATVGCPATPEAIAALAKLDIDGEAHRSETLTPDLIEQADIIFTMTSRHAEAVQAMAPGAAGKILPVDPEGDIADPIGGPQPVYDATAARLREAIARRLKEIEA